MAPGFNTLREDDDGYDSAEDLDFSDLREAHDVRLEQGLDTFVVVDGLPTVEESNKAKLQTFLMKKLSQGGMKIKEDGFFMPMNDSGKSEGFAFVEYQTPQQAVKACKTIHGTAIDRRHTFGVNKITDIDRYGREGRIDDDYAPPELDDFTEKEHLRWWLGDPSCRDQLVMFRGDAVGVYWNKKKDNPELIIERQQWTEKFVTWSPKGTYLATMHPKGMQLWGGPSWARQTRFPHPGVELIDFSPNEQYLCSWSYRAIEVTEDDPILTEDEDGKHYIIWDLATGRPLRSFAMYDLAQPPAGPDGQPVKRQLPWPTFKWSADDKYVARMKEGEGIHVYELPSMKLMDKKQIPIEGILDFEWSPATPRREGVKSYEQLFCFWTPEIGSNPAKVGLMSIPSKEIVRTRNLFNVSDAKLHWQSEASYVCVKVDRHSKSKKSMATNLEIFRVREKGVPVEVVDAMKDTVINFAWEPKGDRFVLITTAEVVMATAVPPKTSVSFFAPEKVKGAGIGNFRLIRTNDKKNNNAIFWSPKGRFCVVGTVLSQQNFDLDFWDFDYEGETHDTTGAAAVGDKIKDLTANLQLMNTADHYGVTDVEWDPTGRYVTTGASVWKHTMENGYHLYSFTGDLLHEAHIDKFKQMLWRPRPATLLSKEEQRIIRKNLREYSKDFEEQDRIEEDKEKGQIVEERRRMLNDWLGWLEEERAMLREERREEGLDVDGEGEDGGAKEEEEGEGKVVEEIMEEVLEESEEVV